MSQHDVPTTFLLIEGTDFTKPIFGSGNATVVSSLMRGFAGSIALVGVTSDPDHVLGHWTQIEMFGHQYDFLPVATSQRMKKPVTRSSNVDLALAVYKYRAALRAKGIHKALTRTYSVLWALNRIKFPWDVCFYYPGLGNPMLIGRKVKFTKFFAGLYSHLQAASLRKHVSQAYAAASDKEIEAYNTYLAEKKTPVRVKPLTTAVDTSVVHPYPQDAARALWKIPPSALVLCFVGRLAEVKGISLLLESFIRLRQDLQAQGDREAIFLLAGDGELRSELEARVRADGIQEYVRFLGMLNKPDLMQALAASDVCVVGSHVEGFSNAMLEQLAVGKPIVSTPVSGASDIIADGVNGYVVQDRDPDVFARRIRDAAELPDVEAYNLALVEEKYAETGLWRRISNEWLQASKN
ncbi:MAG: glycosyltransferase family 4 protein [Rhodobacteraceae bacterium]|nr:glycosyltransferase family 4 protein [Paracoccaceae bacterium]